MASYAPIVPPPHQVTRDPRFPLATADAVCQRVGRATNTIVNTLELGQARLHIAHPWMQDRRERSHLTQARSSVCTLYTAHACTHDQAYDCISCIHGRQDTGKRCPIEETCPQCLQRTHANKRHAPAKLLLSISARSLRSISIVVSSQPTVGSFRCKERERVRVMLSRQQVSEIISEDSNPMKRSVCTRGAGVGFVGSCLVFNRS